MFDISYFRNNPLPFYALAHELYPGKYRPTISHSFVRLLSDKGLLLKLFTQNIDCLERVAGVPGDKIIEAHGSFASQRCIECKTTYPEELMKEAIGKREVPHCLTPECNGLVKPDIVFFGEQLPEEFHRNKFLPSSADLCIVMGTSLTVQPFASLPNFCSENVPRLLINLEQVGSLGSRVDDVLCLGGCDAGVRKLASALGWLKELEELWDETDPANGVDAPKNFAQKSKDEALEEEIEILTNEVDKSLRINADHTSWLRDHLEQKHLGRPPPNVSIDKTENDRISTTPQELVSESNNGEVEKDRLQTVSSPSPSVPATDLSKEATVEDTSIKIV